MTPKLNMLLITIFVITLFLIREFIVSEMECKHHFFSFLSRHNGNLSIVDTIAIIFRSFLVRKLRIGKINLWSDVIWNVIFGIQQRIWFAFSLKIDIIYIIISRSIRILIMIISSAYIITFWMIIWWWLMVCKWIFINTQA